MCRERLEVTHEKRFDPVAVRDAFSLLADETRVQILLALFDRDDPCAFSELRAHTGVADSGRFNYHLGELVGTFVRKESVQGTTGYTLSYAGNRIIGACASGTFTRDLTVESQVLAASCVRCDTQLELQYESEQLSVACNSVRIHSSRRASHRRSSNEPATTICQQRLSAGLVQHTNT